MLKIFDIEMFDSYGSAWCKGMCIEIYRDVLDIFKIPPSYYVLLIHWVMMLSLVPTQYISTL